MGNGEKQSTRKGKRPRGRMIMKSYDTIPLPRGEFKDLFRLMQEQKEENKGRSSQRDKPSK